MFRNLSAALLALAVFSLPVMASAHVVVKPGNVSVGEFTTFTVSVPNEKDMAVNNVRLEIPGNLNYVTPTVKAGWIVNTEKTGSGDSEKTTSITWSDGSIGAGLRDDFTFSAQVPAEKTELIWKAYQTYTDGSVANWNQSPDAKVAEGSNNGPYSTTKVTDDLNESSPAVNNDESSDTLPIVLSLLALTVSIASLLFKKRT